MFLSVVAIRLSERSTRAFSFALTLRLVSSSSFSTRSSLSLFLSRRVLGLLNQPSNQPSKQQRKAPCTRTLETSTISFPLTYTADPFTACTRERIKPEQQTNTEERLQGWTMFGRGVARNRESDSFSLSNNYLSLNSIYRGDFSNKISN